MKTYSATLSIKFSFSSPVLADEIDNRLFSLCPESAYSLTDSTHTRYEITVIGPSSLALRTRMGVFLKTIDGMREDRILQRSWSENTGEFE